MRMDTQVRYLSILHFLRHSPPLSVSSPHQLWRHIVSVSLIPFDKGTMERVRRDQ